MTPPSDTPTTDEIVRFFRHLLRYGGLYIVASLAYVAICVGAYHGPLPGWGGVIGLHLVVALSLWAAHGVGFRP